MVRLPVQGISSTKDLYVHKTAQHIKIRTNTLKAIRTLDPNVQAAKTHLPDRTATIVINGCAITGKVQITFQNMSEFIWSQHNIWFPDIVKFSSVRRR
jgi:hypothetical protein